MKKVIALLVGVGLVFGLVGIFNQGAVPMAEAASKKMLQVEIGETVSKAKMTKKHSLKIEDLENGKMEYMVQSGKGEEYKIKLTEEQVKDILAGTAVMVDTEDGMMKVKITAKEEKKKKSGW